jgi:hypothetical protein
MVGLVLAFPVMVTGELDHRTGIDPAKVQINIPSPDAAGGDEPPPVSFQ